MKFTQKILFFFMLVATITGCEREYDAPPLNEPVYQGPKPNMTIAKLRTECSAATEEKPVVITDDWILKAYVTGNDESGNIYKQIIVQDETGALPIQTDINSLYTTFRRGQEVYINLKGMCVSVYGDEQQLGDPNGYLYRMLLPVFEEKVKKNGWPNIENVKPEVITDISKVNTDVTRMTYRLVQLEGITFENGGKNTFALEDGYGQETLKDAQGNTIVVRTSNFATFAFETLPVGKGAVVGILGRFRGAWQLTIPTYADVLEFDGVAPGGGGGNTDETVLFSETFGTPVNSGGWPFLQSYTGFDNPASMFSGSLDKLSVRVTSGSSDGNVWYPTGADYSLSINGINVQGATTATLVYNVGANVYDPGSVQDLNSLKVKCNGVDLTLASKTVSGDNKDGNKPFEMRVENVTVSGSTTLEFYTTTALNTFGLRLFDVKLVGSGSGGGSNINPVSTE